MIIKKRDIIWQTLKVLEKELENNLPDEGYEAEMIDKIYEIIYEKVKHIKGGIL